MLFLTLLDEFAQQEWLSRQKWSVLCSASIRGASSGKEGCRVGNLAFKGVPWPGPSPTAKSGWCLRPRISGQTTKLVDASRAFNHPSITPSITVFCVK